MVYLPFNFSDFLCIGTGTILNRRTIITAANLIDPWFNRQRDLRIWALGNKGTHKTPYRYRVWRTTRIFPKSLNAEHWHGPRGIHSPRHDICIIHTLDQMFILNYISYNGMYPTRSYLIFKHSTISEILWFSGSGYEYLEHIKENYKIFIAKQFRDNIVDCSKYLPKYWGKFICIINVEGFPGIQNGCGLHTEIDNRDYIVGLGCFEIRYNEDKIYAFTDLRYYVDWITLMAHIRSGEYYEYAYPQWGIRSGFFWDSISVNDPYIPLWQPKDDFYPLGKK